MILLIIFAFLFGLSAVDQKDTFNSDNTLLQEIFTDTILSNKYVIEESAKFALKHLQNTIYLGGITCSDFDKKVYNKYYKIFYKFFNSFDFSSNPPSFKANQNDSLFIKNTEISNLDVFQYIQCIDVDSSEIKLISLSDLHGSKSIIEILKKYIFNSKGELKNKNKIYIFCGDYHDRGKCSEQVLLFLLYCKKLYPKNFYLLKGNHESLNYFYAMLDYSQYRLFKNPISFLTRLLSTTFASMLIVRYSDGKKVTYAHGCIDFGLPKNINERLNEKIIFLFPGYKKKKINNGYEETMEFVFSKDFLETLTTRYSDDETNFNKILDIYKELYWPLVWCDWCYPENYSSTEEKNKSSTLDNNIPHQIIRTESRTQVPFKVLYKIFLDFSNVIFFVTGHTHNAYTLNQLLYNFHYKNKDALIICDALTKIGKAETSIKTQFVLQPPVMQGNFFESRRAITKKYWDQNLQYLQGNFFNICIYPCQIQWLTENSKNKKSENEKKCYVWTDVINCNPSLKM